MGQEKIPKKVADQPRKEQEIKDCKDGKSVGLVYRIISGISKAIHLEVSSPIGRINMIGDLMLLILIAIYLVESTITSVARVLASIWNTGLTNQSGDNFIILLIIFFIAVFLCIGFTYIVDREKIHQEQAERAIQEELKNYID